MDVLIAVIVGIITVVILLGISSVSFVQSWRNITGQKKSLLKAILWLLIALIHAYALIDFFATLAGSGFTSDSAAPPSVLIIYQGFARAAMEYVVELFQWIAGQF